MFEQTFYSQPECLTRRVWGRTWIQQQSQQCLLLLCSIVIMGQSCWVFEDETAMRWPWDGSTCI